MNKFALYLLAFITLAFGGISLAIALTSGGGDDDTETTEDVSCFSGYTCTSSSACGSNQDQSGTCSQNGVSGVCCKAEVAEEEPEDVSVAEVACGSTCDGLTTTCGTGQTCSGGTCKYNGCIGYPGACDAAGCNAVPLACGATCATDVNCQATAGYSCTVNIGLSDPCLLTGTCALGKCVANRCIGYPELCDSTKCAALGTGVCGSTCYVDFNCASGLTCSAKAASLDPCLKNGTCTPGTCGGASCPATTGTSTSTTGTSGGTVVTTPLPTTGILDDSSALLMLGFLLVVFGLISHKVSLLHLAANVSREIAKTPGLINKDLSRRKERSLKIKKLKERKNFENATYNDLLSKEQYDSGDEVDK